MRIDEIQKRLNDIGFDSGPVDGFFGRKTIRALKLFQEKNGLNVDGIPGPKTVSKLFEGIIPESSNNIVPVDLVWLIEAIRLFGVTEKPGPGSNVQILQWGSDLKLPYQNDEIPWCGLFIAHCINSTLPDEPLPANPLKARNWLKFGVRTNPTLGAVMVFSREGGNGDNGHVGLCMGQNHSSYRIIGGNQSDKVCFANIDKTRLLGSVWPSVVSLPQPLVIPDVGNGPQSWNDF
ncbi:TPA: TIGR02594 family protein [Klebsiella variicola subsp. variicola]|nr:TIGR02594 family protein [Klebsiella variicola subsp. variicola]